MMAIIGMFFQNGLTGGAFAFCVLFFFGFVFCLGGWLLRGGSFLFFFGFWLRLEMVWDCLVLGICVVFF